MRKQVWYFKFGYSILGPVVTAARWAGRDYNPENLPSYVYSALKMDPSVRGKRARLFPAMNINEAERALGRMYPLHWRWNRVEIQPE